MFQFSRFPSCTYGFSTRYTSFTCVDCSIRKSMDQCPLTAPHSLSQLVASFFGSQCQGIPLALFVAWPCVLLGSQKLISCRDLLFEIVDFAFWMFSHSPRFICFLFIQFSMYTQTKFWRILFSKFDFVELFITQFPERCEFHKVKSRWSSIRFAISNFGGDERDRTDDPLLAKQVLSQLSYTPIFTFEYQAYLAVLAHILLRFLFTGPSKLNNDCKKTNFVTDLGC